MGQTPRCHQAVGGGGEMRETLVFYREICVLPQDLWEGSVAIGTHKEEDWGAAM